MTKTRMDHESWCAGYETGYYHPESISDVPSWVQDHLSFLLGVIEGQADRVAGKACRFRLEREEVHHPFTVPLDPAICLTNETEIEQWLSEVRAEDGPELRARFREVADRARQMNLARTIMVERREALRKLADS